MRSCLSECNTIIQRHHRRRRKRTRVERYQDREDKDFHLDPVKNEAAPEYEYYCMDKRRQPSLMLLIVSDLSFVKLLPRRIHGDVVLSVTPLTADGP